MRGLRKKSRRSSDDDPRQAGQRDELKDTKREYHLLGGRLGVELDHPEEKVDRKQVLDEQYDPKGEKTECDRGLKAPVVRDPDVGEH